MPGHRCRVTVAGVTPFAAELIKLSLTIGQATPLVIVGAVGVSVLNLLAVLLTVIGLGLVFWKGVLAAS